MGLRDRLLSGADARLKREDVTALVAEEWGEALGDEKLFIREMAGSERDDYEATNVRVKYLADGKVSHEANLANLRARLVAKSLVDSKGDRVFSDGDAGEVGAKLSADVLNRLFEVAQRVSRLKKPEPEVDLKHRPFAEGSTAPPAPAAEPSRNCSTPAPATS